jgi:hypothetical protein
LTVKYICKIVHLLVLIKFVNCAVTLLTAHVWMNLLFRYAFMYIYIYIYIYIYTHHCCDDFVEVEPCRRNISVK